jgi:hypothetical protein
VIAGAVLLAVILGAPGWLLLLAFAAFLGGLATWFGGRVDSGAPWVRKAPRPYLVEEPVLTDRSTFVSGNLRSRDPDLLFLFSCSAHWKVTVGTGSEPDYDYICGLVLERARSLAKLVSVDSPDYVRTLLDESALKGKGVDHPDFPEARIELSDVQVRVEKNTQERWKKISDWSQRMDVLRAEKEHLEGEVWKGVPEVLLWHLARNPDPAKAASAIGPVEKVLRALGVQGDISHGAEEGSFRPGSGASPAVHLVRSVFPEESGERDLFAMRLALLLEHSGDKDAPSLLRRTFMAGSGDADADAEAF